VSFVYVCVWFLSTVIDFLFTESIRWPSYWRHSEMTYISNNSVCVDLFGGCLRFLDLHLSSVFDYFSFTDIPPKKNFYSVYIRRRPNHNLKTNVFLLLLYLLWYEIRILNIMTIWNVRDLVFLSHCVLFHWWLWFVHCFLATNVSLSYLAFQSFNSKYSLQFNWILYLFHEYYIQQFTPATCTLN
jgi:hypothetical protein